MSQKMKILVVDDDPGIGEMLQMLLGLNGYEVLVSDKPLETKENIQEHDIDLVLLDMLISGVNGTHVCAEIRNHKLVADVPVLMMSALHEAGKKCRDAGANDFISKPFEMDDLLTKIKKLTPEIGSK